MRRAACPVEILAGIILSVAEDHPFEGFVPRSSHATIFRDKLCVARSNAMEGEDPRVPKLTDREVFGKKVGVGLRWRVFGVWRAGTAERRTTRGQA